MAANRALRLPRALVSCKRPPAARLDVLVVSGLVLGVLGRPVTESAGPFLELSRAAPQNWQPPGERLGLRGLELLPSLLSLALRLGL